MPGPVARSSPREAPPAEPKSWLLRFGAVVGAGALGSAVAVAPAALRLEGAAGVGSPIGAGALCCAVALVPMTLAVASVRRARITLSALRSSEGATPSAALLAWFLSFFAAMTLLGALFRSRTHHRALGGVVFALVALAVASGLALVLLRVAVLARRATPSARWALAAFGLAALCFVALLAQRGLAGSPPFSRPESARLVDGLAFALAAFVASGDAFANRRALALAGPPFAAIALILGISAWRTCPPLRVALREEAPLLSFLADRAASD